MTDSMEPKFTNPSRKPEERKDIGGATGLLAAIQQEKEPYTVSFLGNDFVVFPNVFSPKYSDSSSRFAEHMPVREGDKVLEVGSGTGIIAITLIQRGAEKVVAADINPDAVKNTLENVKRFGLEDKIDVREGNIYEPLQAGEKFDAIYWNLPFEFIENRELSSLEKAVYDAGYISTEQFIKEAEQHLNPSGRLYIGFSTTLGRYDLLEKFAAEAGYELNTVYEFESKELEHPVKYEIIEATKRMPSY